MGQRQVRPETTQGLIAQGQVPIIQKLGEDSADHPEIGKIVEIPQVQYIHRITIVPVSTQRQTPAMQSPQQRLEIPQTHYSRPSSRCSSWVATPSTNPPDSAQDDGGCSTSVSRSVGRRPCGDAGTKFNWQERPRFHRSRSPTSCPHLDAEADPNSENDSQYF